MVDPTVYTKLFSFATALSTLGMMATGWWRKGSKAEDDMVVTAADTVLDALSDADMLSQIEAVTGMALRDQLTVEEAQELDRERRLRGFSRRN